MCERAHTHIMGYVVLSSRPLKSRLRDNCAGHTQRGITPRVLLYVCMYVCMHACIHTHTHTYTHTHMYVCMYVCMYTHIHTHTHTHTHTHDTYTHTSAGTLVRKLPHRDLQREVVLHQRGHSAARAGLGQVQHRQLLPWRQGHGRSLGGAQV